MTVPALSTAARLKSTFDYHVAIRPWCPAPQKIQPNLAGSHVPGNWIVNTLAPATAMTARVIDFILPVRDKSA